MMGRALSEHIKLKALLTSRQKNRIQTSADSPSKGREQIYEDRFHYPMNSYTKNGNLLGGIYLYELEVG